jgi:DNA (cytosine-5)-methyltransferase 1
MKTVLAIEYDRWAAATYRANFPDVEVWERDVRKCLPEFRAGMADVVMGGPPCTPFSPAGYQRGTFDPNDCVPAYVKAVERIQPLQFILENVPRMLAWYPDLVRYLERLGYDVEFKYFDAAEYGVPQHRNRVWVWGIRGDIASARRWPERTHAAPRSLRLWGGISDWVTLGEAIGRGEVPERRRIAGASGWSGQRILDPREPAPTITSSGNPEWVQSDGGLSRLTVAEMMRLQSAPDDWVWPPGIPKTAQYSIAGNGWPSLLAYRMRRALEEAVPECRTVLDLFAGGGLGASGWHGRFWSREGNDG